MKSDTEGAALGLHSIEQATVRVVSVQSYKLSRANSGRRREWRNVDQKSEDTCTGTGSQKPAQNNDKQVGEL